MSSPLFKGSEKPNSDRKTVQFSDATSIRRIQGTKIDIFIRELNFKRADGQQVGRIQSKAGISMAPEEVLADDEQIIGVYGEYSYTIDSLSIIVWRPFPLKELKEIGLCQT